MIFISVGTEKFPFDRLLRAMDEAVAGKRLAGPVFAQTGCSAYKPAHFPSQAQLSFEEMVHYIGHAHIVVIHAGVGSALMSLRQGKVPVLFPRSAAFGEHLDDHQLEFAKKMEQMKKVLAAYDEDELVRTVQNYDEKIENLGRFEQRQAAYKEKMTRFLKRLV